MKNLIFTIIIISMLIISGCSENNTINDDYNKDGTFTGKGPTESRSYELSNFTSFEIFNDIDANINQGSIFSVVVTTKKDVFDKISITNSNGVLIAKNIADIVLKDTIVTVDITCPDINSIILHNDSDMTINNNFEVKGTLNINLFNDTSLKGKISSTALEANLRSDSSLNLYGKTGLIKISAASDSQALLSNLKGKKAIIDLKSDAICDINVSEDIKLTTKNSPILNVYNGTVTKLGVTEDTQINNKNIK